MTLSIILLFEISIFKSKTHKNFPYKTFLLKQLFVQ